MQNIIFRFLFLLGFALVYSEVFITVPGSSIRAVTKEKNFSFSGKYNLIVDKLSSYLLRFINLPQYKAEEYERMLASLGRNYSAHNYVARTIMQSGIYAVIGICFIPLSPLILFVSLCFSWYLYFSEISSLKTKYLQRKEEIEMELPKLCSVINSRLSSTKNVSIILQSFLPIAGVAMSEELNITLADMKTGNTELALKRMERRINSSKVSDVIRGLISVNNGDDQSVYFQSKQYQFNNDYMTTKKKNISKRQFKLTLPIILTFLFFGAIIAYPFLSNIGEMSKDFI